MDVTERYQEMYEHFDPNIRERKENKQTVKEFLNSQDAAILVPKIVVGVMREAVEPLYNIAASLMPEIRLESGVTIEFPSVGVLRAAFINEGQEYPDDTLDFQRHRQPMDIRVRKVGLAIRISDEMITDSQWDVIGLHLRAAGRAMLRFKEEWCFREWTRHGHVVFDNTLANAQAHTTGLGPDGMPNNTLSVFDFIDIWTSLMASGMVPTTVIMHPLAWTIFAKNEVLNSLGHAMMLPGQNMLLPVQNNITMGPEAIRKQMPMPIEVILSPFVPLDRINKTYDIYIIDRNNIGAIIMRDDLDSEEFREPMKDIRRMKMRERYSPAIFYEGRGVAVAKNIALTPSYNRPVLIRQV